MELIVLGLVATIGVASYALWSKARAEAPPSGPLAPKSNDAAERTPSTLQVGDVVSHLGTDWVVEGVLALSEDGRAEKPRGRLMRLADGGAERFLWSSSSESDPAFVAPAPLAVEGVPAVVQHAGQTFRLTARATVGALRSGAVGPGHAAEHVGLAEYAAGPSRLVVLDWGADSETYVGERVNQQQLELLPAR